MSFSYNSFDLSRIGSSSLIDELKLAFDVSRPMYEFFAMCYDILIADGLIKPEDFIR